MKKLNANYGLFLVVTFFAFILSGHASAQKATPANIAAQDALDPEVVAGLIFMREEEKLARDVYLALYAMHSVNIFNNIAASELTHANAIKNLLDRYAINDPVGDNGPGVFTNSDLQQLYDTLVTAGSPTKLDALYAGATIEDLDIDDIARLMTNLPENSDIFMVYANLLRGSRNHLRSFHKQIVRNNGNYTPTSITQALYDEIVNSPKERGRN